VTTMATARHDNHGDHDWNDSHASHDGYGKYKNWFKQYSGYGSYSYPSYSSYTPCYEPCYDDCYTPCYDSCYSDSGYGGYEDGGYTDSGYGGGDVSQPWEDGSGWWWRCRGQRHRRYQRYATSGPGPVRRDQPRWCPRQHPGPGSGEHDPASRWRRRWEERRNRGELTHREK
jgi:hypothetical protein